MVFDTPQFEKIDNLIAYTRPYFSNWIRFRPTCVHQIYNYNMHARVHQIYNYNFTPNCKKDVEMCIHLYEHKASE